MKKMLLAVGVALVVRSAAAGVEYDFRQTMTSDVDGVPSSDFAGHAIIDGDRSRVDFLSGNTYPPGTYVILNNGARSQTWIDPSKKSYVQVDAESVASAIGTSKIEISNQKINLETLPDHPVIAGLPTDHYRLNITYEITVRFGLIPIKQSVSTTIDKWTTLAYQGVVESFLSDGGLKTGNAQIDKLFDAENTKVPGFALREMSNITTINDTPVQAGSQLKVKRTRTQTRDLTITSIQATAAVSPAKFAIPLGFRKADPLRDDSQKAPLHVLSMEPTPQ